MSVYVLLLFALLGCCFSWCCPWNFGETSIGADRWWCGRFNEHHAEYVGKFYVCLFS